MFTWWKRSSSRSLTLGDAQTPRPSTSHPLFKSSSIQDFSNCPAMTDSSSYYSVSLHSSRPSTAMSRIHRYSSLRNLSMSSRSSNYTDPSSISTAPVHVDILDAQGKFKPSDFRGRIEASGIRDYGEDVAERNLGQNGVELFSPAVKSYYAKLPRDQMRARKHSYPVSILEDPEETETPAADRTRSLSSVHDSSYIPLRPSSRSSMSPFPTNNIPENDTTRGRRLSTLSIGTPTLETASSHATHDRSSSPPAIRRQRPSSAACDLGSSRTTTRPQSMARSGINDLTMWHSVQMHQNDSSHAINEECDYESDDSMASTFAQHLKASSATRTRQPLETLAELSDYTTDGSDIEAYMEKRRRQDVPDDEALLFNEDCFGGDAHGALPGLFDQLSEPDVPDAIPESEQREEELSASESVPTPTFPTSVFVSQRDRLLALGFDYESEDEHVYTAATEVCTKPEPAAPLGLGIVKTAAARRKEAKRQQIGHLKHNRRARRRGGYEEDGNDADVE